MSGVAEHSKRRVAYMYDDEFAQYSYGEWHVMQPKRVGMAHELVKAYGLTSHLEIKRPSLCSQAVVQNYHEEDYVKTLKRASELPLTVGNEELSKYGLGILDLEKKQKPECPVFEGLLRMCRLSASGSIAAATQLREGNADIAINWSGGLHHAQKSRASGYCYVNDIVLGILELLKSYERVLYVDIDLHHGDGVEKAFEESDRVMTVSFHKYGLLPRNGAQFFPGTGKLEDIGSGSGKGYSVNVPLKSGITDDSYQSIFKPIMTAVMEHFRPSAVVLQCGADSLNGDKLGVFNMTLKGHGECVRFFRAYNVPLMLLGGGGYTPVNVARCWAYETAIALGKEDELSEDLPDNAFLADYKGNQPRLHINASRAHRNQNSKDYLNGLRARICDNLRQLPAAPSVQMHDPSKGVGSQLNVLSDFALPKVLDELATSNVKRALSELNVQADGEKDDAAPAVKRANMPRACRAMKNCA